ncbi:MAG: hypothetical protein ABSB53_02555 [Nitrososphaerales archaeon]
MIRQASLLRKIQPKFIEMSRAYWYINRIGPILCALAAGLIYRPVLESKQSQGWR